MQEVGYDDGPKGPITNLLQIVPHGYYVLFATKIMLPSHLKFDSLRM